MPKRKQTTSTGQGKANSASPAPTFLPQPPNSLAGLSQDTRFLLIRQIDEEIARLERTANELIAVKNQMIGIANQEANRVAASSPTSTPAEPPAKRRGRPPGSKNKPKEPVAPTPPAADPVNPTQPTQTDMFQEAVEATRPERDEEFAKAS